MVDFVQQVINGVALGCIYALIALGFVLIYKATEVVNFAQGELLMFGAFFAYTFIELWGLNYWIALPMAIVATAAVGASLDRVVIRPIVGQPQFSIIMLTIGIGYVARSVVTMVPGWGTDYYSFATPFSGGSSRLGEFIIPHDRASIVVGTVLLCSVLYTFFKYTRLGVAMQAASQNMLAAYYMGIPVKRVFTMIWAISAATAAVAGVLLAPTVQVSANMGLIGLAAFPAAVLGGFGSIPGAVVGGIIIGLVQILAGFYLSPELHHTMPYIVLLVMLVLKPEGLFGSTAGKKV